jgi:hypothetical protein
MARSDLALVGVEFESVDTEFANYIENANPLPKFLAICVNVASEIAYDPQRAALVITGDFVQSTKSRLGDSEAAKSYGLMRGEGFVGGKTIPQDDRVVVLLHAEIFERALNFEANPDAAFLFLKTLVHEMNHVSMYQRGESSFSPDRKSWKEDNLTSAASAIIDEYRAELGAINRMPIDQCEWDPGEIYRHLEDDLLRTVTEYQDHRDVNRLAFEVGSHVLIALKPLAYCVAFETVSGELVSMDLEDLRYSQARDRLPAWFTDYRNLLSGIPSGENDLPRADEQAFVAQLSRLVDTHLRIFGFNWDEPRFSISHDFLALI